MVGVSGACQAKIATEVGERWNEAAFVELFSTSRAALKWQDYCRSNSDTDEPIRAPVLYRGRKLLDLLSYADILDLAHKEHSCY
jgi:hypothetical protein